MSCIRRILIFVIVACTGCASAPPHASSPVSPPADSTDELSATIGIVRHPEVKPLVVDLLTDVIPLNADGTMPRMAVHVKRSTPQAFLLSYKVYRRVPGSESYVPTETSPLWRIQPGAVSADALIRPDFVDGVFIGDYRFEIFVDQASWRTVEFKVVPHDATAAPRQAD